MVPNIHKDLMIIMTAKNQQVNFRFYVYICQLCIWQMLLSTATYSAMSAERFSKHLLKL